MWETYHTVSSLEDALEIIDSEQKKAKIIAGGTDLVLEIKKGQHPEVRTLVDINRINGLDKIWEEGDFVHISPLVTHNQALVSKTMINYALPLVKAAQSIGAAQIRNVGTIFGNVITASPANDTISPLVALEAELHIQSKSEKRWVSIADFYLGVRNTILRDDEMVTDLRFKKLKPNQKGIFIKYLLRNTHGISVVNVTMILAFERDLIADAKITLGAVAPIIIHAKKAEEFLLEKVINPETITETGRLCLEAAKPISDIRASEEYRDDIIPLLVEKALNEIQSGKWKEFPRKPVLLWGKMDHQLMPTQKSFVHNRQVPIKTSINDKQYSISSGQNKTLIDLVREEAGLTGTKLGCGEGECGACTLFLNGVPVLSCLIPAPRAQDAEIITIEGISDGERLHPVQQAFIDEGAVQCGYCTPGFIMSAVKLLEEKPNPSQLEIREGLAGNLCRCTGYYSIIRAVEKAARENNVEF
ncbi:MAG: FAD binding domain-containing protein [Anaerolineaceae bacterium]|nr:FAD binding domain-containing protein [Anaerolineaceae bacterium]